MRPTKLNVKLIFAKQKKKKKKWGHLWLYYATRVRIDHIRDRTHKDHRGTRQSSNLCSP